MPELDRTPSAAELERLVTDEGEFAVYPAPPSPGTQKAIPLWDQVEGAWTAPFPQDGIELRLRKVVYQCCSCTYASVWSNDINSHIQNTRTNSIAHRTAEIETAIDPNHGAYFLCTACGMKNQFRRPVQEHIAQWMNRIGTHEEDGHRVVQRFLAAPPVQPMPPTPVHQEEENAPKVRVNYSRLSSRQRRLYRTRGIGSH